MGLSWPSKPSRLTVLAVCALEACSSRTSMRLPWRSMRRVLVLVLLAALFVYCIDQTWPRPVVLWRRQLGGKLGLTSDADGPDVLLAGITAVCITLATIRYAQLHPFPRARETYG